MATIASALSGGVGPGDDEPGVQREQQGGDRHHAGEDELVSAGECEGHARNLAALERWDKGEVEQASRLIRPLKGRLGTWRVLKDVTYTRSFRTRLWPSRRFSARITEVAPRRGASPGFSRIGSRHRAGAGRPTADHNPEPSEEIRGERRDRDWRFSRSHLSGPAPAGAHRTTRGARSTDARDRGLSRPPAFGLPDAGIRRKETSRGTPLRRHRSGASA